MHFRPAKSHLASRPFFSAFRIAAIYALFGVLWILLSDQFLAFWLKSPEAMTRAQTVKGWAYVLVTAGLVHSLVRAHLARIEESTQLLQKSQNRLEMALRGAELGLWDWDIPSGKVVFDERWAAMLGYSLSELKPEIATWENLVHPEEKERILGAMTAHLEGRLENFEAEHRLRTKEGSWKWILAKGRIVERDDRNRPVRVSGTHLDIDSRKKVELEWIRLATAVEQAAEIIFITDTSGVIQYVNPAFEKIMGYSAQEALGQTTQFLKSGKHDSEFYAKIWKTISGGEVWSGRISNRCKNGSLIEEEASLSPIRDLEKRIVGYVAVMRDVTEQIELEEQLRQSQKMEAVGQLAGGIAHDFNNLLQAILGYTSIALDALPPEHPVRHDLDQAMEAAQPCGPGTNRADLDQPLRERPRRDARWRPSHN
jgi:PAS domain S-box-containing protein